MLRLPILRAILAAFILVAACAPTAPATLLLATTTSIADSGLLDEILPVFESAQRTQVKVIAVGTGQALKLAGDGNADLVLVHARELEDAFIAAGSGINRRDVMFNDFVIVGPHSDPARIARTVSASAAFAQLAETQSAFVSRGDNSGTYTKEKSVWAAAKIAVGREVGWYYSVGQGMGETLVFTNERQAYTLTDRGTWLSMRGKLPNLTLLFGGATLLENPDRQLHNPYGIITVNPAKHLHVNHTLAERFTLWITSLETQQKIADFGRERFGQPLFYPASVEWKAVHP